MYRMSTVGGLIALVVSVPLSMILPPSLAFENGPIENFQVVLLICASIYSLRLMLDSYAHGAKAFHVFCALGFVLLTLRELSWGRVFYQTDFDAKGPVFVPMSDYAWRFEAHIFIAVVVLLMLFLLIKHLPLRRLRSSRLPIALFAIVLVGVIMQYSGEHGYLIGKTHGQVLEELCETIIYAMQPFLCSYYHSTLK